MQAFSGVVSPSQGGQVRRADGVRLGPEDQLLPPQWQAGGWRPLSQPGHSRGDEPWSGHETNCWFQARIKDARSLVGVILFCTQPLQLSYSNQKSRVDST